ncbi:MAG: STAS domain-containing protein [Christensenellaceae bacterium]|nr:STAS domain-containing protein [Christensenellaceae bacterium]
MTIEKYAENEKLTLKISGRLDTTTAPDLEKEIGDSLEGVEELVMDMEGLEYISSAGLRVILKAQKQMNTQGSMKLVNVNDSVLEVFDITGFIDILTIE